MLEVAPELLITVIGEQAIKIEAQRRQLVALHETLKELSAKIESEQFANEANKTNCERLARELAESRNGVAHG
jgi:hypothetical protein